MLVYQLVVEPIRLKNMLVKMGSSSPSRVNIKKYLKPQDLDEMVKLVYLPFPYAPCMEYIHLHLP